MSDLLDLCNKCLDYNIETGCFIWRVSGKVKKGDKAGCNHLGYVRIKLKGKSHMAHRLAFLMYYNRMPDFIDHIDGDKSNNAISNLRECTKFQNGYNRGPKKDNTSGYKGVTRKNSKWQSKISYEGKEIYLGVYECKHDAAMAHNVAAKKYHGEFAYLNKIARFTQSRINGATNNEAGK